jgi:hypothetical protein
LLASAPPGIQKAAVAAVPADACALAIHPTNDTRAELVNYSIK